VRRGHARSAIGVVFLLLGASIAEGSDALPKTHAAMLDSVAGMAAADLVRPGSIPAGHAVRIATPLAGDTLGFLAQRIVEQLRRGGTEVRLVPTRATADAGAGEDPPSRAAQDTTDLLLNVEVRSAGVSYVRPVRGFLGTRGYRRLASMQVGATLMDPVTHDVLWARSATAQAQDEVRRRDLSYAQTGSAGLVPLPPHAGAGPRLLEPLIVVGVVAGLVVLFYSNRN
jgi:hypothetical protein